MRTHTQPKPKTVDKHGQDLTARPESRGATECNAKNDKVWTHTKPEADDTFGRNSISGSEYHKATQIPVTTGPGSRDTPAAGDTSDCLNATEVDAIAGNRADLPSRVFYDAGDNTAALKAIGERLRRVMDQKGRAHFIIWCRHHWMAVEAQQQERGWGAIVRDSAFSEPVRRAATSALVLAGASSVRFLRVPQQHRDSNECGLFAGLFLCMAHDHVPIPLHGNKISLAHLRPLLRTDIKEFRRRGFAAMRSELEARRTDAYINDPYGGGKKRVTIQAPIEPGDGTSRNTMPGVRRSALDPRAKPWTPQESAHGAREAFDTVATVTRFTHTPSARNGKDILTSGGKPGATADSDDECFEDTTIDVDATTGDQSPYKQ